MNKNNITIKVEGATAIGKSTITLAIVKALKEFGLEVDLDDTGYRDVNHLEHSMEHDITLSERMSVIYDKTKVTIKEITTKK